jgi:hypothetical protein
MTDKCCNHDCNQGRTCPKRSRIIDAVNQTKQDMKGNNMKEEALKLADEMDNIEFCDNPNSDPYEWACDAQKMIFKLVEELDKKKATSSVNDIASDADQNLLDSNKSLTQTKPLSDEEIGDIYFKYGAKDEWFKFARAIEKRHGIK